MTDGDQLNDQHQLDYYRRRATEIGIAVASLLEEYEAGHGPGAPCFNDVLLALRAVEATNA